MLNTPAQTLRAVVRSADSAIGRTFGRPRVLVDCRTPMNLAVLAPMWRDLMADDRLSVWFSGLNRPDMARAFDAAGLTSRVVSRRKARMLRWDLFLNADPWDPPTLWRCRRRVNFFHGVAGKYNLECPTHLPLDFDRYDRVAFPNAVRMRRYMDAGLVRADRAALVGFPKLDALVNSRVAPRATARALGLTADRPTAIYAPTFSPESSLLRHGEPIVRSLLNSGLQVIVKLHDRSLDPDPRYSGGQDWPRRFAPFASTGRFLFASNGDSTEYLLASDLMVTDHSTIGFEFCALDRPLIVFNVPELIDAARIDRGKAALLQSAADVVSGVDELSAAVDHALSHPDERAAARAAAVNEVFHDPGRATARALTLCYALLECPALPASKRLSAATR